MKKLIYIIITFLILITQSFSFEKGHWKFDTLWKYVGDTFTLTWGPVTNATKYEVIVYHAETETQLYVGETTNTEIDYTFERTGHYIFMIRAYKMENGVEVYTDYSHTTQPEKSSVNGEPKGWWVYVQLPPILDFGLD